MRCFSIGLGAALFSTEIFDMFADVQLAKRISDAGQELRATTPEGLAAYMREESERWSKVITSS